MIGRLNHVAIAVPDLEAAVLGGGIFIVTARLATFDAETGVLLSEVELSANPETVSPSPDGQLPSLFWLLCR